MTTLYVNWSQEKIITVDEYVEMNETKTEEMMKDERYVDDYLNEAYYPHEIFEMDEAQKDVAREEMKQFFREEVDRQLEYDGWDSIQIDI